MCAIQLLTHKCTEDIQKELNRQGECTRQRTLLIPVVLLHIDQFQYFKPYCRCLHISLSSYSQLFGIISCILIYFIQLNIFVTTHDIYSLTGMTTQSCPYELIILSFRLLTSSFVFSFLFLLYVNIESKLNEYPSSINYFHQNTFY